MGTLDPEYYMYQMHVLAYGYHWSPSELWEMPVSERNQWFKQICKQYDAEREAVEKK